MIITGIGDEAANTIERQINAHSELGWKWIEMRGVEVPGYAKVPETTFLRTYVCADMSKCLCFYRAPDEAAVLRARAAVEQPALRERGRFVHARSHRVARGHAPFQGGSDRLLVVGDAP